MNIKINKEQHERLCKTNYYEYKFGSRLFGTNREDSDYDYMRIYNYKDVFKEDFKGLPNIHSLQYDDSENNSQYIWVTQEQFWENLISGDGTIHSDILMFSENRINNCLEICRTFKIIRAYCGVSKRDLKLHNSKNKLFHANRSLYIAECLIDNILPTKEKMQEIALNLENKEVLLQKEIRLRQKASDMYQNHLLHNYYIPETEDDLLNVLLSANNIREFKY
jgi:hypothetical protein